MHDFVHCFQFLLGFAIVPGEIESNADAKFGGQTKKALFGKCESGTYISSLAPKFGAGLRPYASTKAKLFSVNTIQ